MGNVIRFKKPSPSEKNKGNTLCRRGFHKWELVKGTPFDSQSGRLVTRYRCLRCGKTRVESK